MKADQNITTRPVRARASGSVGRVQRARSVAVYDTDAVRRQRAIRDFFRAEVDALRALGDDYVALRRAGGQALH